MLQNAVAAIVRELLSQSADARCSCHGARPRPAARPKRRPRSCSTYFGIASTYHDKLPGDIPYGVQRLLSVALAYGTGAKVLLLDEPAAGLGGGDMQRLADVLISLRRRNIALVVIEHHMDLIMSIADRIVMIDQGAMLADGNAGGDPARSARARSLSGARRMSGVLECEGLSVRYAGNVALVAASTSACPRATWSAWSAPTAPARARWSMRSPAGRAAAPAVVGSGAAGRRSGSTGLPPHRARRAAG